MMKRYIKKKFNPFGFRDKFTIKDETGKELYFAGGAAIGSRLTITDTDGKTVAVINRNLTPIFLFLNSSNFAIEINDKKICEVSQKFKLIGFQEFEIAGLPWKADGLFSVHEYKLKDGDKILMQVTENIKSLTDSYELDIQAPEHELACICIALSIDSLQK